MAKKILNFAEVQKLHRAGNNAEATAGYLQLLKQQPNNVEILHALAILFAQEDKFAEAKTYLQTAIQLQPKNPVLYLHLANVYKYEGLFSEAREILQHIIENDPNCISAYNNLGIIYHAEGRFPEAIQAYRLALDKQPDYIDAHYNLGLALIKNNELDATVKLYENLLEHAPKHFAARFHLACTLMRLEKISQAEAHFLIIEKEHPYHVETQSNLATCFLKQGALIEAKKHYLAALELAPTDTQILFNLGVINTQLDNTDGAIQNYQQALQINPDYFEAHNNLGGLFLAKQHPGLALPHFQAALRLQPENQAIRYTVDALTKNQRLLTAPPEYISTLFDAYADHYDAHLVKALDYQVPILLFDAIKKISTLPNASWEILDLGCGTGLCGIPFKSAAKKLTGVDLSTKMLHEAQQKNIYDELKAEDVILFLKKQQSHYHLILAGDVLVYSGDLEPLFTAVYSTLYPNGFFVFNAEISTDHDFQVNQSGRFAHHKNYLDNLAKKHQLNLAFYASSVTRLQNNAPVYGHIYVLQRL